MKKKLLLVCCTAALVLSACGGGSSSNTTESNNAETVQESVEEKTEEESQQSTNVISEENNEAEIESNDPDIYGAWILDKPVDEFGDTVENAMPVLKTYDNDADFSNTATSSSPLDVSIFGTVSEVSNSKSNFLFVFRLNEYENTPATYTSDSQMSIKIKVNDVIEEYKLIGFPPNGDVYLGIYDDGGDKLFNNLYYGNDVRCIVYIDNSKYNFEIKSKGFADACAVAQTQYEAIVEDQKIKTAGKAINALLNEERQNEAYNYFKDNHESFDQLTDEEISNEIQGSFFSISMNDVGAVTTRWYIMEYNGDERYQSYYFKEGKATEKPEKTDFHHSYTIHDNTIDENDGKYVYQVRKLAEGYYLLLKDDSEKGAIPTYLLIKNNEGAVELSPTYPIPE